MYLRDTAIILKSEPFREQDVRLSMFGRRFGKMQAVSRAGQKLTAKNFGHLEPFSEIEVMIASGAAFDKLAVARLTRVRRRLRQSLSALSVAGAFASMVHELTHPGETQDEKLFDVLSETMNLAEAYPAEPSRDRSQLLLAAAALKMLDALGYGPDLTLGATHRVAPTPTAFRLLRFARGRPLCDLLYVTADVSVFREATACVCEMMKQAPFASEPHGMKTLAEMLG